MGTITGSNRKGCKCERVIECHHSLLRIFHHKNHKNGEKHRALISSFLSVWVTEDITFSNAFWMLTYIFIGSYLTYILALIVKDKKPRILIVLLSSGLFFYNRQDYYLLFVIGVIIAYIMVYFDKLYKARMVLGVIFIFVGLFWGGYPSGVIPDNIYHYSNFAHKF